MNDTETANSSEIINNPATSAPEAQPVAQTSEVAKPPEQVPALSEHSAPAETAAAETAEAAHAEPSVSAGAPGTASVPPAASAPAAPQKPAIERIAAGTFSPDLFRNAPAAAVKRFILTRAGFGLDSPEVSRLPDVRLDDPDKTLARVPEVFPPADWPEDKPLQSVADWLACVDDCQRLPSPQAGDGS